jgi:hypothetical protein
MTKPGVLTTTELIILPSTKNYFHFFTSGLGAADLLFSNCRITPSHLRRSPIASVGHIVEVKQTIGTSHRDLEDSRNGLLYHHRAKTRRKAPCLIRAAFVQTLRIRGSLALRNRPGFSLISSARIRPQPPGTTAPAASAPPTSTDAGGFHNFSRCSRY